MRAFDVIRHEDESGVSGTGHVAQGVEFDNGWVAMTWLGKVTSVVFYPSLEDAIAIHGHDGKTTFHIRHCPPDIKGPLGYNDRMFHRGDKRPGLGFYGDGGIPQELD